MSASGRGSAVHTDPLAAVAAYAMRYVRGGQTLGLGTGRAATAFICALGASGIKVRAVATSQASASLARQLGIELVSLDEVQAIDIDFDGADEVDPGLNLIKGHGGALVREKVVAAASRRLVVLVGAEKLVPRLGERASLPVEVVRFATPLAVRRLWELGLKPKLRINEYGSEFVTDNGNFILDCAIRQVNNPRRLEQELLSIPGVVGTGLFISMADAVLVGEGDGAVRVLRRRRPRTRASAVKGRTHRSPAKAKRLRPSR